MEKYENTEAFGFKVGDYVFDPRQGLGIVVYLNLGDSRPIEVVFLKGGFDLYSPCGKLLFDDNFPSIRLATEEEIGEHSYDKTKTVNGFKVPDVALTSKPASRVYLVPSFCGYSLFKRNSWDNSAFDHAVLETSMCYFDTAIGLDAVSKHTLALLGKGMPE